MAYDREGSIDGAWENFGYIIVEDCCREWMEHEMSVRGLEIMKGYIERKIAEAEDAASKQRLRRRLKTVKGNLASQKGFRKACENWLDSDFCFGLCGYTKDELIGNMRERLRDHGMR